MSVTLDDLTALTDLELDGVLMRLYRDHLNGDEPGRAECHLVIMAVLQEQSARRWASLTSAASPPT